MASFQVTGPVYFYTLHAQYHKNQEVSVLAKFANWLACKRPT